MKAAIRWALHKRLMLANAQAVGWLLGEQGLAAQVLHDALGLADSGFAGFQAPACLALAEAFRVCQPKNRADIDKALQWAQQAAHNVQDPSFCARMTARVNAMRQVWWPDFAVRERYRRLCRRGVAAGIRGAAQGWATVRRPSPRCPDSA